MDNPKSTQGRIGRILLTLTASIVIWMVVCLIDSTWYYFTVLVKGNPPPWLRIVEHNAPYWVVAAILSLPVIAITRRFDFRHGGHWRALTVHAITVVPFAIIHVAGFRFWNLVSDGGTIHWTKFRFAVQSNLSTTLDKEILLYVVLVGAVSAYDYYRRYQEKERAAAALELEQARLKASLSEAKLGALKMQLQPHFLFNAMHAISTLILKGESKAANTMLLHLSQFLRMTLDSGDAPVVALSVELEFLDAYLRIQRVRFGERLQVRMEIEEGTLSAEVPNLILQPLVENSIRHGIAASPGEGLIIIRARRRGERLELQVQDNGTGLHGGGAYEEGVGLTNIRARLAQLYPDEHRFTLETLEGGGTLATVRIPYRDAGSVHGNRPVAAGARGGGHGEDPGADRG